jgi:hypothetical protein
MAEYEIPTDDDELHTYAMEKFAWCDEFYGKLYHDGEYDQEFLYGKNQWNPEDLASRNRDRRPSLTLNQLLPFAKQVINDIKQSRPAIRVSPVDDKADIETAEIYQGIIRNIERQSNANVAYDTAAMNSVGTGYGWIRVKTDYCDPMSFDQEILIERVMNFQSVYIDPMSESLDGSDAEMAFVFDDMTKDEFEKEYPDASIESVEDASKVWFQDDTVRIAEFFYKDYDEREIVLTDNGVITRAEADLLEEAGVPFEEIETRKSKFPVIRWCKFSGAEILEKNEWVGKYIPIVPVYGEEVWINGRREAHSLISQAKDAQRMYNYWSTANTEYVALQQKAPYIGAEGSFASFPDEWANANNENYAFLEYDVVMDENQQRVEPPQRQPPVMGSPAMIQGAQTAQQDIRNALGMHEASLGQQGNEMSGIAIRNRQIYGDNATFHFMDNLSASISQVGCILVDLIPRLYSKRKITRILGEDGKEENVPINQGFVTDQDSGNKRPVSEGERAEGIYDLSAGKYDVVCDVGASYSSKRQELADKVTELLKVAPELSQISADIVVEALDLPMAKELADRIRSQMPPELLGDDPQAAKLQQASQAIAQMEEQLNNALAALEDKQKDEKFNQALDAEKAQLERDEFQVRAEKTKADIDKIYADIAANQANQVVTGNESAEAALAKDNIINLTAHVDDLRQTVSILLDDIEENVENPLPLEEGPTLEEAEQ